MPAGRRTYRLSGGRLYPVPGYSEQVADYIVFADDNGSVENLDLFICTSAPDGHEHSTALTPLGRHPDFVSITSAARSNAPAFS